MPEQQDPAARAPGSDEHAAATPGAGEDGDEFGSAFKEFAGAGNAPPEPDAPAPKAAAEPEPEPKPDPEPEPAPASAAPRREEDPGEAERARDRETWEKLDDAGRFSAFRAAKGRARQEVSTLARRNQELERALAEAQRRAQAPAPTPAAKPAPSGEGAGGQPTAAEIAHAGTSAAAWDAFAKDYPEVAAAMDARLDARLDEVLATHEKKISGLDAALRPALERVERETTREELAVLSGVHEDWQEVVAEDSAYWQWLATQSPGTQQLANSPYGADVASAITLYKATNPERFADPHRGGDAPPSEVQRLQQQRDQRLAGTAMPASRPRNTARPADTSDFSGAFKAFAAEEERRQHRAQ